MSYSSLSDSFQTLESSFQTIDTNIDTLIKSTSGLELTYSTTVNIRDCFNNHREDLINKLNKNVDKLLSKLNLNYKQLLQKIKLFQSNQIDIKHDLINELTVLRFQTGSLHLDDVHFEHMFYKNDFNFNEKLKYIHLCTDNQVIECINLDDIYNNRSNYFIVPISQHKLFVHFKSKNLIQILVVKRVLNRTKTSVLYQLQLDEAYYCKFYVYNLKILAVLLDKPNILLSLYDENLRLIVAKYFNQETLNIVSLNEKELLCWSYESGYLLLNSMDLNKVINIEMTGKLLHVSSKRVYCFEENESAIKIYDRQTLNFINSLSVNCSSSHCFRFDAMSRIHIKTKEMSDKIFCYDENGNSLFVNSCHLFQLYDYFDFIDNNHVNLVDLGQRLIAIV